MTAAEPKETAQSNQRTFAVDDLKGIQNRLTNWWNHGPQDNPLLLIRAANDNRSQLPDTEDLEQHWTDTDFIMDRAIKTIDGTNHYGIALPFHYIDFSASAMPCSLGGRIHYVSKDTVWSHPVFDHIEDILDVSLAEDNIAYHTQIETTRRSSAIAKDHHYVSPWALGGILDTIAGLYGTENLLTDLALRPDSVKTVVDYLTQLWLDEFKNNIGLIETSANTGHVCCWTGIWAPGSTFPIQEDFAYMISPDMFRDFCLPAIERMVDAMDYPLFHLDGTGMIPHLDMLLAIDKLRVIQWQPGAGKQRLDRWYDLIRRILAAGKSCQVFADPDEIEGLTRNVGTEGLLAIINNPDNKDADILLNSFGE